MNKSLGVPRWFIALLVALALLGSAGRVALAGGDVEQRIADFWKRIDAMQPGDYVSSADLGQWALNVVERDASARLTVADLRISTAAMQAAMDRAGRAPDGATAPTPTPAPSADLPIILKAGMSVTYTNGWKITVLRTEPQAASTYSTPKPGMQYVAAIVRYDNGTLVEASFNSYDWEMQDSAGVRRRESFFYPSRNDALNSGKLAPGGFVQGAIVFEVPVGDARLSLLYSKYGYKLATWQLY